MSYPQWRRDAEKEALIFEALEVIRDLGYDVPENYLEAALAPGLAFAARAIEDYAAERFYEFFGVAMEADEEASLFTGEPAMSSKYYALAFAHYLLPVAQSTGSLDSDDHADTRVAARRMMKHRDDYIYSITGEGDKS